MEKLERHPNSIEDLKGFNYDEMGNAINDLISENQKLRECVKYLAKEVDHLKDRVMGIEKSWGNMAQVDITKILK